MPALLALILWAASMGLHMYSQSVVSAASREAARHAAIHGTGDPASIHTVAGRVLELVLPPNPAFVANHESITVEQSGDTITVTIAYNYVPFVSYDAILGLLGGTAGTDTRIYGVSHFRRELP